MRSFKPFVLLAILVTAAAGAVAGVWWCLSTAFTLLSESDGGFVKETVLLCGTIVLCVFLIGTALRRNLLLRLRERQRPHKLRLFGKIVEDVTHAAIRAGAGFPSDSETFPEPLQSECPRCARELIFCSTPRVIHAYRAVWDSETSQELARRFDSLLDAMRNDLGLSTVLIPSGGLIDLLAIDAAPALNSATPPKPKSAEARRRRAER